MNQSHTNTNGLNNVYGPVEDKEKRELLWVCGFSEAHKQCCYSVTTTLNSQREKQIRYIKIEDQRLKEIITNASHLRVLFFFIIFFSEF